MAEPIILDTKQGAEGEAVAAGLVVLAVQQSWRR